MDLQLDDDQKMIAESAQAFLADACPSSRVRAFMDSGAAFDAPLWSEVAGLGWSGVLWPESAGGLGLGLIAAALLQEQLGQRLACVPFFESAVLGATWLQACGPVAGELASALAAGEQRAVPALPRPGAPASLSARSGPEGWVLDGLCPAVAGAGAADLLLLAARTEDGSTALFAVPRATPGLTVQDAPGIDPTRPAADLRLSRLALGPTACLARGAAADQVLWHTQALGAIALAAEQVGVAQQALDLTVAYVRERHQFGRAVGSFQAVKHRCAQMLVAVESARSAVFEAACTAEAQPDARTLLFAAAQARCAATEAALMVTREALQLHGGVGFTWEYDPHLYLRRAQAQAQLLPPVGWWHEQVAIRLLDPIGAEA
jgi:alkylation response protein AidB-like acyl-CoA dehydrogenase